MKRTKLKQIKNQNIIIMNRKISTTFLLLFISAVILFYGCKDNNTKKNQNENKSAQTSTSNDSIIANKYYSGFSEAHDTYNAISVASDNKVYYVLSSLPHDIGAQMYRYDPSTDKTEFLADLSEAIGEKQKKYIAQGKSHTEFYEVDNKLYFSTHIGYYEMINGQEHLPKTAPYGYKLYPGGHFLYFDLKTDKITSLAIAPHGEGILTMIMDKERKQLYGITWPSGYFIHYDIDKNQLKDLGKIDGIGEMGVIDKDYRVLCRSMFVEPQSGNVYYSTVNGDIFYYNPEEGALKKLSDVDLRLDYFGKYDLNGAGSMGFNWRKIFWYEKEKVAYGVHGNTGYLFRFDPMNKKIELVTRLASEKSQKNGTYDQFSYGYLGFTLGKDDTIYYLTGSPIFEDGKQIKGVDKINRGAAKGQEHLHLITYNIPEQKYVDHGGIFYADGKYPTYVNSIAIDKSGDIYTLARFINQGKEIEDLIKIPFKNK